MEKCCLSIRLEGFLLSLILRLLRLTWKVRFKGREHLDQCYNMRNNFLICFWHGKYVPIFSLLEGLEACVISSQSKRGSVIAELCKNFGFQSTQISDRPGSGSIRHLSELLHNARMGGIAVDGPLGPRNQVKPGVIWMASAFEFDLLPCFCRQQPDSCIEQKVGQDGDPATFCDCLPCIWQTRKGSCQD